MTDYAFYARMNEMIDKNLEIEAAQAVATRYDQKRSLEVLRDLAKIHQRYGFMPSRLGAFKEQVITDLMLRVKRMDNDAYNEILLGSRRPENIKEAGELDP